MDSDEAPPDARSVISTKSIGRAMEGTKTNWNEMESVLTAVRAEPRGGDTEIEDYDRSEETSNVSTVTAGHSPEDESDDAVQYK